MKSFEIRFKKKGEKIFKAKGIFYTMFSALLEFNRMILSNKYNHLEITNGYIDPESDKRKTFYIYKTMEEI